MTNQSPIELLRELYDLRGQINYDSIIWKDVAAAITAADKEFNEPGDEYDGNFYTDDRSEFADPGGRSALRAGVREFPCPTCERPNQLTAADVANHYQCDRCADNLEMGIDE